jgi:DNA-binding transcriptional MerR regulator
MEGSFHKKHVSISKAAEFLNVSVDTIRRWDEKGILHPTRPDGKNRYFSIEELEKVKFSQPLTISEAAQRLEVSEVTLRRLEEKGLIKPDRDKNGNRIYTLDCLEKFIESDYYLRRKEIEDKILSTPETSATDHKDYLKDVESLREQHKIISARLEDHHKYIHGLNIFRKTIYASLFAFLTVILVLVALFTLLFIAYPEGTGRWFGLYIPRASAEVSSPVQTGKGKVLGATYVSPNYNQPTILAQILRPIGGLSLELTRQINPQSYDRVIPANQISNINDIFSVDANKDVVANYNLTFPDTSYFKIPDKNLISNLNADYLHGRVPGSGPGDLTYFDGNNSIAGLVVSQNNLDDRGISDIKLSQITSPNKVAGSAIQLFIGGGLENHNGLSLLTSCGFNQVLQWNGSSWICATNSGTPPTYYSVTNPLSYNPATGVFSLNYNPNNLALDGSNQLNTIQGISTSATPTFAGLTIGGINGILIATGGSVSTTTNNSANWDTAFAHTSLTNNPHHVTANQVLPSQAGQNGKVLGTNGADVAWVTNSMGVAWGAITGTLTDQADLNSALSGKEPAISAGLNSQYWRGDKSWQTLNATAVGLGNVENTALSTWVGTTNITTLGTISTGTWNATPIGDSKISSSGNWNTAYGWGNHALAGYFVKATDDLDDIAAGITNVHLTTTLKSQYDAAYSHKTTEDAINGIVKVNGAGTYSAVTDNSTNWDAGYTYRVTSASGTAPLTLTLAANALTGSVADAASGSKGVVPASGTPATNQYLQAAATTGAISWVQIASVDINNSTFVTSVSGSGAISSSGGLTPAISVADAAADGATKGAAAFTASDFDAAAGVISIDYTNGQAASALTKGFLTAADWSTFNGKQAAGNYITGLTGDVTATGPGSVATIIASGAVSLSKMANLPANTIIGNNTGAPATPVALSVSDTKTLLSLNNVENTALSTWVGTTNITTLGTISTGTWNGTIIADGKIDSALTGKTYNGLTITTSTGTLTIANGKTLTASNSLTLTGTDSSSIAFGTGGTVAYTTDLSNYVPYTGATADVDLGTHKLTAASFIIGANGSIKPSAANGAYSFDEYDGTHMIVLQTAAHRVGWGPLNLSTGSSYTYSDTTTGKFVIGSSVNTGNSLTVNDNSGVTRLSVAADGSAVTLGTTLALGANSLTMTGSIGATGARVTKGWFTDLETTNSLTVNGTAISAIYVPYTGATADVNLGTHNITATKLITSGGALSQFVKGDGSLDSNAYLTSESDPIWTADKPNYVPYAGATADVNLGQNSYIAGTNVVPAGTLGHVRFLAAEAITTHAQYGFADISTINMSGVGLQGHASFDEDVVISGTANFDHHHSYQATPHFDSSGTLTEMSTFWAYPYIDSGEVTTLNGYYFSNPYGSGIIDNLYGIKIDNLTRGTNNWSIYTGSATSYFGGDTQTKGNIYAGYGGSGNRGIYLGSVGNTASVLYNASTGNLDITPRSGYNVNFTAGHITLEGVTSTGATGTGKFVFNTSPTLVTPTLGVATATSIAIGANTLDTNEWAFLDGQNQAVKTTSSPSFAGLTVDTNTLFVDSVNHRVGIGTTAPVASLQINPTITATTDARMLQSGIVYNGATAMANWYGGYIAAPTGTGTITNKYAFVTEANAGNVGIGTTTPGTKLTVSGGSIRVIGDGQFVGVTNTAITGTFYMSYDASLNADIINNAGAGNIYIRPGNGARGTGLTLLSGGNVGIGTTTPNSLLQVAGAISTAITNKTAAYTVTASDSVLTGDASTASFTFTLPTASGIAGRKYTFVKTDSSANTVTIAGNGTETINGATTKVLSTQWARCEIVSNGTNWIIVGE